MLNKAAKIEKEAVHMLLVEDDVVDGKAVKRFFRKPGNGVFKGKEILK